MKIINQTKLKSKVHLLKSNWLIGLYNNFLWGPEHNNVNEFTEAFFRRFKSKIKYFTILMTVYQKQVNVCSNVLHVIFQEYMKYQYGFSYFSGAVKNSSHSNKLLLSLFYRVIS